MTNNTTHVVLFGDSRAADWWSPTVPGFEFSNRGLPGYTSAEVLHWFDKLVSPLQPDWMVVQVGVNDLSLLMSRPNALEQVIPPCQDNIARLVDAALARDITVVLTTIFAVADAPFNWPGTDIISEAINRVNTFIVTLARAEVIIMDAHQLLASEHGLTHRAYASDAFHLNPTGYAVLNEELAKILVPAS